MNSREKVLEAIRKNKPADTALPSLNHSGKSGAGLLAAFTDTLARIGGVYEEVDGYEPINAYLLEKKGVRVINAIKELRDCDINEFINTSAGDLENVNTYFVKGTIAIAENGGIWVTEKNMGNRLLPFLCEQLVIVIEEKDIVYNMHEAYENITINEEGYGLFIAGPSKTADIEQSLVVGAHGPLGLQVFIIKNKN